MDEAQSEHLKAYGLAYFSLVQGMDVEWLLNFRGGSFLLKDTSLLRKKANLIGVNFSLVTSSDVSSIRKVIEDHNMEAILLEKAPKIAVYTPPDKEPWDDAVRLALEYAEVPYDTLWDNEVLRGELYKYDWLHLHHEDFTGQFGKFYGSFGQSAWYKKRVLQAKMMAKEAGFSSVQEHKGEVALKIKQYVERGGFLFAMCSACDTLDIALASLGIDIIEREIDGDPVEPGFQDRLDYSRCLFFENFTLIPDPFVYEHSDIDISEYRGSLGPTFDAFTLFDFSAKYDPVPTMLTQNHARVIKGFMGQCTFFKRGLIKPYVTILADIPGTEKVKYVYVPYGDGCAVFYAGHDPEDYQHAVGEEPTNLSLYKTSPGYRLILNNILFPAAKKKKRKT
jgi:hypothetical protein